MKKLALIAYAAFATSAFAGPNGIISPAISITGTSVQTSALVASSATNKATDGGVALQNLTSNVGEVTIGGTSSQTMNATDSTIINTAHGENSFASQNLASNFGKVTVGSGSSTQTVTLSGLASVMNTAGHNSKAVQNIASNSSCISCKE